MLRQYNPDEGAAQVVLELFRCEDSVFETLDELIECHALDGKTGAVGEYLHSQSSTCSMNCRFRGFSYPEDQMKTALLSIGSLDRKGLITHIVETVREPIVNLQQMVGPGLRELLDSRDMPFSTMNALHTYRERLVKSVAILKEAIVKLQELTEINPPTDTQPASHGQLSG
jgi:hypothetical protein